MDRRLFVDVSNYTERFDAHRYANAGALVVMVLATDGESFESAQYQEQARHAHEAGLSVWHYHFARPEADPGAIGEAAHFWRVVKPEYHAGDRLVLDIERRHPAGPAGLIDYTHRLDQRLHAISGVHAGAYTYDSLLRDTGSGWQVASQEWHIADYGPKPARLGAGRHLIAWQLNDGEVGDPPLRYPGVAGADVNRLQRWYLRRLLRARARRR